MSPWRNSPLWRPRQFGLTTPAEPVPVLCWIMPSALGVLLLLGAQAATGAMPPAPAGLGQLGFFNGNLAWTLAWSALWGLPCIVASLALRLMLMNAGWFGWASALLAGALAGVSVPIMLGPSFWLAGPFYGAVTLMMQQTIYRARDRKTFDSQPS